jgi:hypothetical protein
MGVRADLRSLAEAVRERCADHVDELTPASSPIVLSVPHQRAATDMETVAEPDDEAAAEGLVQGTSLAIGPDDLQGPVGGEATVALGRETLQPLHEATAALCMRIERSELVAESVGAQLTELTAAVTALHTRLDSVLPARPKASTSGNSLTFTEAREEHHRLLRRAAQVSHAQLVCHRDSWEFLVGQAGRHSHFRMPAQLVDHGEGRVAAALSGRSLIAVLISLDETRRAGSRRWRRRPGDGRDHLRADQRGTDRLGIVRRDGHHHARRPQPPRRHRAGPPRRGRGRRGVRIMIGRAATA